MNTQTSEGLHGADDCYWTRITWLLLGGLLLVRVGYLLIFPVDLAGDESYYWDWSRRLDWAYYSKPPLVAWIIWLGTQAGDTLFFLKLPAALFSVGTTAMLGLLAQRLYSARAAFWTVVVSATMPGTVLSGMTMTIDAPLLFCWACALLCTAHALGLTHNGRCSGQSSQTAWGIAAAIAVGVGLLAKLSMGVYWFGLVFLWLFPGKQRQRPALMRWFLLALLSAAFLIPFLMWNWQRHWITFEHTSTSFGVEQWNFPDAFGRGCEYVGSQLGALHPIWWVTLIVIAVLSIRHWQSLDPRTRFLAAFSTPLVLGALLLAFYQRVQPNWPAAFYLASTVILGALLSGNNPFGRSTAPTRNRLPGWGKVGVWLGAILVVLLYLIPFALERTGYVGHRLDPFARIRGWQAFAGEVQQLREQTFGGETTTPHFIWVGGHRYPTSQLAFYLPDQPRTYRYDPSGLIYSQYEMWPGPAQDGRIGQDALLLLPAELEEEQLPEWSQHFERVIPLGLVHHEIGNGRVLQMNAFHGVYLKK